MSDIGVVTWTYAISSFRSRCRVSIEFRPDGTVIEIDSTYSEVPGTRRVGRRLLSNRHHAVEIIVGKKRERLLVQYNRQHFTKPRTEVIVPEVKVLPAATNVEQIIVADATPPTQSDEEAEQEFLNAVPADDRTLYEPLEDEWFSARVVHR